MLFFLLSVDGRAQILDELRSKYLTAASEKTVCENLINELREIPEKHPVELAYLGALETIWAKHVFSPFSKLETFKKGTRKIEQAVQQDSVNIEIRYLRLSIQKSVPGILGYSDDIEKDTAFMRNHFGEISSVALRNKVQEILEN